MNRPSRRHFFIAALAAAALLILSGFAPTTHAATFGRTTVAANVSGGLSGNYKRGSRFTLSESGVLTGMSAYLDGFGGPQSGSQEIRLVLYRDANGVPGVKVTETFPVFVPAQSPGRWWGFDCHETPLVPGSYWIVILSGSFNAGIARDYGDGSANWYGNADVADDGAESPFGSGSTGTVTLSVYATYLTSAQRRVGGRASIAATPSKGLTADFKRASKFTIPVGGRILSLAAYMDGRGNPSSFSYQQLGVALYRDQGGVPGPRIAEMQGQSSIGSGTPAAWISERATPITLTPGSYWIALHTGATAGIGRDYGDGAETNWYANADTFDDGPSAQFGSGSVGTGTLSAGVIYDPRPPQIRTLGRTSIGSQPSKGLSADFIRGLHVGSTGAVAAQSSATALWAYLDGNGGASGSQQMRMVLFNTTYKGGVADVAAQSSVISIPAGMSARWVRFPLETPIWMDLDEYVVALHSGGTAGVARSYGGDSPDSWIGAPDLFSDGPGGATGGLETNAQLGTGTPSMYLEYAVPAQ